VGIPIYIINRNRLQSTWALVRWLLTADDVGTITILDQDSTYPPLLEWYQDLLIEAPLVGNRVAVNFLKENAGPLSFWDKGFDRTVAGPYVVTDVVPSPSCPRNLLAKLWAKLEAYPNKGKAGPGLRIDNLPDAFPLARQMARLQLERYWTDALDPECFSAAIDTTFALYRPGGYIGSMDYSAVRMNAPYLFEHVPWYVWPLDEEEKYYLSHAEGWSSMAINAKTYGWL
jgi:hypothetical protein